MNHRSREIVVDGYNLLHALYHPEPSTPFEPFRRKLEQRLLHFQTAHNRPVTLVYDGDGRHGDSCSHSPLHTVFTSRRKSADRWIVDYVKSLNPSVKMVTIVSSDEEIRRYASAFGAECIKSEVFSAMLRPRSGRRGDGEERADNRKKFSSDELTGEEVERWKLLFDRKQGD
ncbi:MAG: NYN domain-containing protein [Chlorobium sp.]|nr:NYN domain-containing protein [Chlorobium phaeovibrioides]NQU46148.1 NYN domain-containing protein [Chlorobium sp.]